MEWRARILSDLFAGVEIGLLGLDFPTPAVCSRLIKDGVLARGLPPEPGTEVRVTVDGRPEWRTLVPHGQGFLAHSDRYGAMAIRISKADADLFIVDRMTLYRDIAMDLGCSRAAPERHAMGVWSIGVKHLNNVGSARVFIVEQGAAKNDLEQAIRQAVFKWLCVLAIGSPIAGLDAMGAEIGKVIFGGVLESNDARFLSVALEEMDAITPPPQKGARIDIETKPALLVVNEVSLRLPMNQSHPATGVLLLNYLFEKPYTVIPIWKLESEVFPEKRTHQDMAFGTDDVFDEKTVASIRADAEKAARELAALRRKNDASKSEIESAEDEVERLMDALNASRTSGGRKKQLGESSSESSRQRVKNNLRKVFDEVQKQDAKIGEQLKSAVRQGYEVMFLPPPDWGM